ncbi:hypothetical protein [Streptomyces sp. NPDC006784]|uniref:hypothetical protein n=1 Tax=Streptomyces sp. NPDC006784 TaxID=3364764 RepID=UPI0036C521E2
MADHQDDIDADWLAIYGIDLDAQHVPARRFIALTDRLPAYQSAIAARIAAEQQDQQQEQAPASAAPDAPQEVSVEAMNLIMPGLIETVEV